MIAIRAVMRFGWEVPNPITSEHPDNATRFPFSVILPSPASTTYDLTFTVKDDESSPQAIENATVLCGGVEKKTNSSGQAVFKVPGNTAYTYGVLAEGKQPNMGKVEIETSAKSVNVTLLGE